jgi:hypothetical protein
MAGMLFKVDPRLITVPSRVFELCCAVILHPSKDLAGERGSGINIDRLAY